MSSVPLSPRRHRLWIRVHLKGSAGLCVRATLSAKWWVFLRRTAKGSQRSKHHLCYHTQISTERLLPDARSYCTACMFQNRHKLCMANPRSQPGRFALALPAVLMHGNQPLVRGLGALLLSRGACYPTNRGDVRRSTRIFPYRRGNRLLCCARTTGTQHVSSTGIIYASDHREMFLASRCFV